MTVQTFKNEELNDTLFSIENQEEWSNIAAELGMPHQLGFIEKSKSPLPYPYINKSMGNIFKTLCPVSVEFKRYDKTPIPLEVMKELSFSVKENYFNKIEVWYDDKTPDPFAVGFIQKFNVNYYEGGENGKFKSTEYEFSTKEQAKNWCETMGHKESSVNCLENKYLIARWADELRPMEELKALAKERLFDKYISEWEEEMRKFKSKIESAQNLIGKYLSGEISEWDLSR